MTVPFAPRSSMRHCTQRTIWSPSVPRARAHVGVSTRRPPEQAREVPTAAQPCPFASALQVEKVVAEGPVAVDPPAAEPAAKGRHHDLLVAEAMRTRDSEIKKLKRTVLQLYDTNERIKGDLAAILYGKYGDRSVVVQQHGQRRAWSSQICSIEFNEANLDRISEVQMPCRAVLCPAPQACGEG